MHASMKYWIGEHIRAARRKKGLTQAELARAIGRKQSYLSKLEGRQRDPGFHELLMLLQVLGATLPQVDGLRQANTSVPRPPDQLDVI